MGSLRAGERWMLYGGLVAVGLNLRGPIVAPAPVLEDLRETLGISETAAGLLTTAPVLCFAVISPLVPVLARRIGTNLAVAVSLAMLTLAVGLRPWWGFGPLLMGTVAMGAAITVGNVLLPAVARREFSANSGVAMSATTASLIISASVAAILTAPLAAVMGWRAALAVYAVLALAALLVWWLVFLRTRTSGATEAPVTGPPGTERSGAGDGERSVDSSGGTEEPQRVASAWRALGAWELGIFFGLQSLLYYAATAWLPSMLRDGAGVDSASAGTALSMLQLWGIAGALAVPVILRMVPNRYTVVLMLLVLWVSLFAGMWLAPSAWAVWSLLGGLAQGGALAVGLSLIVDRSSGAAAARTVSGTVQTVGYCLGATGPVAIGGVIAATGSYTVPWPIFIAISLVWGVVGFRAAAPHPIR